MVTTIRFMCGTRSGSTRRACRQPTRGAGTLRAGVVHSMAVAEPPIEYAREPGDTTGRWRTFADVVAFTLGTNVWISIVILPAIFVGVLHTFGQIVAALLPFAVLILGLARRSEA